MDSTEVTGGSMAYEYDRFEREDGGGSFLMGLLAGTVLGAGLGMLFAPKPGSELRTKLTEQAGKLRSTAADGYQQASGKVTQIVDRGREAYDRARSTSERYFGWRKRDREHAGCGQSGRRKRQRQREHVRRPHGWRTVG